MEIVHKKNTAYYLVIPMIDSTTPASFKAGLTPTDTAYSKTGSGVWTALAIADVLTEIASTGVYALSLIAAELNFDQVLIKASSAGAADTMVLLRMYNNDIDDIAGDVDNTNDNVLDVNDDIEEVIEDIALIPGGSKGPSVLS